MEEVLINVILPLYLLIFFGYVAGKLKPELETSTISTAVLYVFAPALIFSSFRNLDISESEFWGISAAALVVFVGVYLLAVTVERLFLSGKNEAFELSVTVMNAGYLGIPLIYLLFGEKAVPIAVTFMVAMAVYHFSLGILILNSNLRTGIFEALKIPLLHAAVLSFLLKDLCLPQGIERTLELTGESSLPLMLFSIGVSLSRISLSFVGLSVLGTAVRFFGGMGVACVAVKVLPLSPLA